MKFSELDFQPHPELEGVQAMVFFENGYGISIIKAKGSYGFEDGLYEAAVLEGTEEDYFVAYSTPIADDILGYLSPSDVECMLSSVSKLVGE